MTTPGPVRKRKKSTPSTIDRLDPEIRERIEKLRVDYGWTIAELLDELHRLGQTHVSRSAVGRHVMSLADLTDKMRQAKTVVGALYKEADDETETKMLSVISQLIEANVLKLLIAESEGVEVTYSPKESRELAQVVSFLSKKRMDDLAFVEQREKRAAEKATKEASEKAVSAARAKGLSKDVVEAIRYAVLGSDT